MAEKTEDLKLPLAVIGRLLKEALPEGVIISKEARIAIARAASVFILHTTNFANDSASNAKRKTMMAQDVINGIEELEHDELVIPVKEAVELWKQQKPTKKSTKKSADKSSDDSIPHLEREELVTDESAAVDTFESSEMTNNEDTISPDEIEEEEMIGN